MDHPGFVRGLQRLGDRKSFVDRDGALGDTIRQRLPLNQFKNQRLLTFCFFQPVDVTVFGWFSDARTLASRSNLASRSGGCYPTTVPAAPGEVESLSLKRHRILPKWNYTLTPRAVSK